MKVREYTEYSPDGHIVGAGGATDGDYETIESIKRIVEGVWSRDTHYVDVSGHPIVRERPRIAATIDKISLAVGETATLTPLPATAIITINGGSPIPVDDGSLEIEGVHPMVYKIHVEAWPYRPLDLEVTCVSS